MKKKLCLFLCVIILMVSAESYAAVSYTLPEKMQKQLEIGSGLKGNLTFHGEGNHPILSAVQFLQDIELQIRGLRSENDLHYYIYQAGKNEEQVGKTELYYHDNQFYIRSDLIPGKTFSIPGFEKLFDLFLSFHGENPSFGSVLWQWIQLKSEKQTLLLNPVVTEMCNQLEIWVSQFATITEGKALENGTTAIEILYTIPMSEAKKEIISLLMSLLNSDYGQNLINQILSAEQKEIYANINLDYFYQDALNSLDNDYDILYTRTVSTLGVPISSMLELPLDENRMNFQSIIFEEKGGMISFTLRDEDQLITVLSTQDANLEKDNSFNVWFIIRPNQNTVENKTDTKLYHSFKINISHQTEISADEDSREHQQDHWNVSIERDVSKLPDEEDPSNYPEEDPVYLNLILHYFSKHSQSSPTTLEIDGILKGKDFILQLQGQLKSASPWPFSPFKTENVIDLFKLSEEDRSIIFADFLAAASEQLFSISTENNSLDDVQ